MNRSKLKLTLVCLSALALFGCQHTYQEIPAANHLARPKLSADAMVYVPIPPDGHFKKELVVDSGKRAALAVRDAFAHHVKRAYIGRRVEEFEEGLRTARSNHCNYLVYPTIAHWEDRNTEFSGRRDKIEIKIEVADSASGAILDAIVLRGKSRWFTDGGDSPQDLLQEPLRRYAASLFQTVSVPSGLR